MLLRNTPETVERLKEVGAFAPRQRATWRELWKLFPELGAPDPKNQKTTAKEVEILGQQIVESELDNILCQGSDGMLGKSLAGAVNAQLNLAMLAQKTRKPISQPATKITGGRGGGGGGVAVAARPIRKPGCWAKHLLMKRFELHCRILM